MRVGVIPTAAVHHFAVDRLMAVPELDARSVNAASKLEVLPWPRGVTGSP